MFDELADPALSRAWLRTTEKEGWDGFFVWVTSVGESRFATWPTLDHPGGDRHRHRANPTGPMVTPLARRRPAKVSPGAATLDLLSGGR